MEAEAEAEAVVVEAEAEAIDGLAASTSLPLTEPGPLMQPGFECEN